MARQLKRWESPRKEGRNSKGKGGSARQRQVRKQMKALRKRLKDHPNPDHSFQPNIKLTEIKEGRDHPVLFPLWFLALMHLAPLEAFYNQCTAKTWQNNIFQRARL
jgi:hypothetical protein